MAIVVAMEHMTLAAVKDRLSEVVNRVDTQHERVMITRHGKPTAVIIAADDLRCLEETLAILSDAQIMAELRTSDGSVAFDMTYDEAREHFGRKPE